MDNTKVNVVIKSRLRFKILLIMVYINLYLFKIDSTKIIKEKLEKNFDKYFHYKTVHS